MATITSGTRYCWKGERTRGGITQDWWDIQSHAALSATGATGSGWRAEYDAEDDSWAVWSPYGGGARIYVRASIMLGLADPE